MRENDLSPVFLAAPTSPDERLKRIAEASRGFVYAVSRTGVTGQRQQLADDARKLVKRLRRVTRLPVALGFGISTTEQFAEVGEFADAVVVGSAIVETVERNCGHEAAAVGSFVRGLTSSQPVAVSLMNRDGGLEVKIPKLTSQRARR
jgi:tryptophan synthase alpha chain